MINALILCCSAGVPARGSVQLTGLSAPKENRRCQVQVELARTWLACPLLLAAWPLIHVAAVGMESQGPSCASGEQNRFQCCFWHGNGQGAFRETFMASTTSCCWPCLQWHMYDVPVAVVELLTKTKEGKSRRRRSVGFGFLFFCVERTMVSVLARHFQLSPVGPEGSGMGLSMQSSDSLSA